MSQAKEVNKDYSNQNSPEKTYKKDQINNSNAKSALQQHKSGNKPQSQDKQEPSANQNPDKSNQDQQDGNASSEGENQEDSSANRQEDDQDRSENIDDNKSSGDPQDSQIKSEQKEDEDAKESGDDTKKQEPSSGKKCFNKLCTSKKIYKKLRSKVQNAKYRFLCKQCYQNYCNNSFCEFCQQIYSNTGWAQDDDQWIGCDQCDRWNHIECEKKYRNKNINQIKDESTVYLCLSCSCKAKSNANLGGQKLRKKDYPMNDQTKMPFKQKLQISKDQRIQIFNKKIQNLPNLQYFLQNYNFRLWINQNLIRQDIQTLRSAQKRINQEQFKKNKKVKLD